MLPSETAISESQSPGTAANHRRLTYALGALGVLLAVVFLVGLTIPASVFTYDRPIRWMVPIARILGHNGSGLLRFIAIYGALWTVYVAAVWVSLRSGSARALRTVVAISVVLVALATVTYPGGSRDIWHNIADGRLIAAHSQNPMIVSPYVYNRTDPVMAAMSAWDFIPGASHYGPLWYLFTAALAFIARESLLANLVGFKLIETVFFLAAIPLVYRLAERLRPHSGTTAVVAFSWNPLMLWSGPLDGHNDIVMVFFVLASLHEMVAKRYETALPLLFLGALTKYTALLVLPVILIHGIRSSGLRSLPSLAFGLGGGLALSLAIWIPFWDGPQTLQGLREGASGAVQSPVAALLFMLSVERASLLEVSEPYRFFFTAAFLALAAFFLVRYWQLHEHRPEDAIWTVFVIICAYLYVGLWWFWPQYITWLLPLGIILGSRVSLALVVVFSASAMTIVMFHGWWWTLVGADQAAYNQAVALAVFLPPLLLLTLRSAMTLPRRFSP